MDLLDCIKSEGNLGMTGKWLLQCWENEEAKARGAAPIWSESVKNSFTDQGLNHILNVVMDSATQITTWYTVLSSTNTAFAAGMTYASPSFTETTAYSVPASTHRAVWTANGTSSAKSITNSSAPGSYTMNAGITIYGMGIVGGGSGGLTGGDTAGGGTLLCYALLGTAQPVISGNVVTATYTITDSTS